MCLHIKLYGILQSGVGVFLFECLDLVFFELEYLELVFILLEYLELVIFFLHLVVLVFCRRYFPPYCVWCVVAFFSYSRVPAINPGLDGWEVGTVFSSHLFPGTLLMWTLSVKHVE